VQDEVEVRRVAWYGRPCRWKAVEGEGGADMVGDVELSMPGDVGLFKLRESSLGRCAGCVTDAGSLLRCTANCRLHSLKLVRSRGQPLLGHAVAVAVCRRGSWGRGRAGQERECVSLCESPLVEALGGCR